MGVAAMDMAAIAEAVATRVYQAATLDARFYLNPGVSWRRVQRGRQGELRPLPEYLLYVPAISLVILVTKFLFERYLAFPLGRYLRVSECRPTPPEPNAVLEKAYKRDSRPNEKLVMGLAKSIDKPVRFVERWYRRKRSVDVPSAMRKFQEGSWRFAAYTALLIAGSLIIPNKPYWTNTWLCWKGHPNLSMPVDVFWYYIAELSFYVSLTISQFMDIKRKDFWQMFVHHVATILLIIFSYAANYFALGSMIMFIHDMADPPLELAKVMGYTRRSNEGRSIKQTIGEGIFILFMFVFFYTRLYLFPTRCINSSYFEMRKMGGGVQWPMWYVFNILLATLYVLHLFWSIQIIRVVRESILAGKVKGDVRSDDEGPAQDEDDDAKNGKSPSAPVSPAKPKAANGSNGHNRGGGGGQRR